MGECYSFDSRMMAGGLPAFLHTFPSFLSSDYLFKLLLIGDSGVGKSCLLLRFAVSKKFPIPSIWGPGWWPEGEGGNPENSGCKTWETKDEVAGLASNISD